mmetsp:Transcript_27778/g.47231  ORF Transcript_27778/g.47231 Transcript_27778/m.47231 type:complete len:233 (+) Transcript_27778:210-908(+)|eukprot:CAMPEP_0183774456 /NCGR_PEP_ID=MMETSP0739-20130205/42064_1 /TAXON_ID=385413 /ORGANISM="Thalassiosira miniscula, Strain CCMP1093" /LENGTH=232 /DNA_ID=CAMNT_0026015793 /DNA_START=109 /DNA_END=807 /DNA_ORIENTATION=+
MELIVDFPDQSSTSLIMRFVEQIIPRCEEERCEISEINELCGGEDLSQTFICSDETPPLLVDFPSTSSYGKDVDTPLLDASVSTASVAFEAWADVKYIESWMEDHKESLWLTQSDFNAFVNERKRDVKVINIIQRSNIIDNRNDHIKTKLLIERIENADITTMGIEYYVNGNIIMNEFALRRKEHRKNVLEEQARQQQCQDEDPELIANSSRKESEQSTKEALARGMQHAKG